MTDKEAYELLVKYAGGEKGLAMIREMIHVAGLEVAIKNTLTVLNEQYKNVPEDLNAWICQSFTYLEKQMKLPLN